MTTTVEDSRIPYTADTWRQRAVAAIRHALRDTPNNATEKQVRNILKLAYPFWERKYWPYKIWLEEVRAELNRRGLQHEHAVSKWTQGQLRLFFNCAGPLRVEQVCHYCLAGKHPTRSPSEGRCFVCADAHQQAKAINTNPTFQSLARAQRNGDHMGRLMLNDWFLEHGYDDLAQQLAAFKATKPKPPRHRPITALDEL